MTLQEALEGLAAAEADMERAAAEAVARPADPAAASEYYRAGGALVAAQARCREVIARAIRAEGARFRDLMTARLAEQITAIRPDAFGDGGEP